MHHRPVPVAQCRSWHHLQAQPQWDATNEWLVTDDMGEMLQKFSMTMADNFARHRNESRSVMNMARSQSDGLYIAFTDGYAGALRVGDAIINGCLRVSDDINDLPAPQLHASYLWRTATGVTDALRTLQNICGTNIPELTPIATAFWNDYRGKLLRQESRHERQEGGTTTGAAEADADAAGGLES